MAPSYVSDKELKLLQDELYSRYTVLRQTLDCRTPTTTTDGAGGGGHYWKNPEHVRLLHSTPTQRKLAVDDFSAILRRIAAIK